jgi:hypothetical protein
MSWVRDISDWCNRQMSEVTRITSNNTGNAMMRIAWLVSLIVLDPRGVF